MLSNTVVQMLTSESTPIEVTRAYVQLVGTLSRSTSQKTGQMLGDLMTVILASCGEDEEDESREVGLQVSYLSRSLPTHGSGGCKIYRETKQTFAPRTDLWAYVVLIRRLRVSCSDARLK